MSAVPKSRHCGLVFQKARPLVKKMAFRWYGFFFLKYSHPVFFQFHEERVEVDIVHEYDSEHCGRLRLWFLIPDTSDFNQTTTGTTCILSYAYAYTSTSSSPTCHAKPRRVSCWKCSHTSGKSNIQRPSSRKKNNRKVQHYNDSSYNHYVDVAAVVIIYRC